MATATNRLSRFARLVRTGKVAKAKGDPSLGIDLGTGNIVLSVVDVEGSPVAGACRSSTVVRDGIVVDWIGAVRVVGELLRELEQRTGHTFDAANVAVPPGVDEATAKIFTNVAEACGIGHHRIVDEPVAAARALDLVDGAVIDVGHGTTGVSVLDGGRTVLSVDEATGGHHMTLVLAGALGLDHDAAEAMKKDPARADLVFGIIRPTLEKMATIARDALAGIDTPEVVVVGGASSLPGSAALFSDVLGRPVHRPDEPLFPTPLGTAMWREP